MGDTVQIDGALQQIRVGAEARLPELVAQDDLRTPTDSNSSTLACAIIWKFISEPARRTGSPVQHSSVPSTATAVCILNGDITANINGANVVGKTTGAQCLQSGLPVPDPPGTTDGLRTCTCRWCYVRSIRVVAPCLMRGLCRVVCIVRSLRRCVSCTVYVAVGVAVAA